MKTMVKKPMTALLSATVLVCALSAAVSADGIETYDVSSDKKYSSLEISGTTATCKSNYYSTNTSIKSIKINHTLALDAGLITLPIASWSATSNGSSASLTNTKSSLASGTYQLESTFTVTNADGKSETVTIYSSKKTV